MSFDKSFYEWLLPTEGGYVNDPDDKGGETYRGVARNFWPDWEGWGLIDNTDKNQSNANITRILDSDPTLQQMLGVFYKVNFWDITAGDEMHEAVSHCVFDFHINSGKSRAVKHLQRGIIVCGTTLTPDGVLGPATIEAANQIDPASLCSAMLADRAAFYQVLAQKNPSQVRFLRGWLNRVAACEIFITQNYLA